MSESKPVAVLIEDDPQIRRFMRTGLTSHGFTLFEAETGQAGLTEAATRKPDIVILDLGLPDMDGVEVVRRLREWTALPIIILSARSLESDKIAALDAGADDYLTKPFGMGELLARRRVALRHASRPEGTNSNGLFETGRPEWRLRIDALNRRVQAGGKEVHLTPIEYRLLSVLVRHAGMVLTHGQLLKDVWGPGYADRAHYLRIHMAGLRRKLEADPARPQLLITEPGVGYRLLTDPC